MKLVRYGEKGAEKPGLIDAGGRLRDLSREISDIGPAALVPEVLDRLKALEAEALPLVDGSPRLGTPLTGIGKLCCIGRNYAEHAKESGGEVPPEPMLFMKATSAINGPYDDVPMPRGAAAVDYEAELGVVIGKTAKYVAEADAFDHVAGYVIFNDATERDFQRNRGGQFTKGKSCDGFAPIGPWLVTRDEVPDPQKLAITLTVDGEIRQNGTTADMVYKVAHLVSYLSLFFTLHTGDVIATGTPSGVAMGMNPPGYIQSGQVVRIEITGLGHQESRFVADA